MENEPSGWALATLRHDSNDSLRGLQQTGEQLERVVHEKSASETKSVASCRNDFTGLGAHQAAGMSSLIACAE